MPRYVAFLRAINVGNRIVKMQDLRTHFESLGFANVATLIASGNVIFESPSRTGSALEKKISSSLEATLGYDVATFVRTMDEVRAAGRFDRLTPDGPGAVLHVGFAERPLDAAAIRRLKSFNGKVDEFAARGREIYWLARKGWSGTECSPAKLEKTLGIALTFRNITTLRRLADKH